MGTEPGWGSREPQGPSVGPGQRGTWPLTAHRTEGGWRGLHDQRRQRQWTEVINENCSRTSASLIRRRCFLLCPGAFQLPAPNRVKLQSRRTTRSPRLYTGFSAWCPQGSQPPNEMTLASSSSASIHEHMQICTHTHTRVCTQKHIYTHVHTCLCTHTHTYTHVRPGWAELPFCSFMLPFAPGLPPEVFWKTAS